MTRHLGDSLLGRVTLVFTIQIRGQRHPTFALLFILSQSVGFEKGLLLQCLSLYIRHLGFYLHNHSDKLAVS